ncbi:MAG: 3'-5' exonuclease [Winogradskyella sp.]|uniref:3'-5' exonuclease n=1 Tax=Winogradskyella sp. TaxID=1883156 RepID=UPI0017A72ED1|nr:3'-5' exonuclease [Winogradskyella sp.]MBT8246131.1 3'-5' exonuclease [Winogradskyella sp.]NNK22666.1 3'-5' exonuclease [Winogradskyella sp.]
MNWFKRKSYPDFWNAYISKFEAPDKQDLEDIRFVIFDTETSGLNTKSDRILSIGSIAITNLQIVVSDQYECYVKQDAFNSETVQIHGLLKEGHLQKQDEEQAIKYFLEYIENSVLVAHHAAFDIAMINHSLLRMGLPKLKNKVLDTGNLYQKIKKNTLKIHYGLDELAKEYSIPLHDRHTASGDAYITALLFLKIVAKLRANQNLNLKDLLRTVKRMGLL